MERDGWDGVKIEVEEIQYVMSRIIPAALTFCAGGLYTKLMTASTHTSLPLYEMKEHLFSLSHLLKRCQTDYLTHTVWETFTYKKKTAALQLFSSSALRDTNMQTFVVSVKQTSLESFCCTTITWRPTTGFMETVTKLWSPLRTHTYKHGVTHSTHRLKAKHLMETFLLAQNAMHVLLGFLSFVSCLVSQQPSS